MATECSITEIKSILTAMWGSDDAKNISTCVWGPPGCAKTTAIEQMAAGMSNCELRVFLTSTMDPTDVSGVPFPFELGEGKGITNFYPPKDLFELTTAYPDGRPTIACFDDLPASNDQVFAALFRLFQQREVGGVKLRDNVFLIATGNRAQDKAAAREIPTPLKNRCWHVNVRLDSKEWQEWAVPAGIPKEIVAFIAARPDFLFDEDFASRGDVSFYTPRSVETAGRMLKTVGLEDRVLAHIAMSGACGEAWSTEFLGYCDNFYRITKPEDIVKDPTGCAVPTEMDLLHATNTSLAYYVLENATFNNLIAAYKYSLRYDHPEMLVVLTQMTRPAWGSLPAAERTKVATDKVYGEIFQKVGQYIDFV